MRVRLAPRLRIFLAGAIAGCAALGVVVWILQRSTIPDWIVKPLQRADTSGNADAIVVLGADAWEPCGPSLSSLRRTFAGVELLHAGRAPLLVFTGGATEASRGVPVAGVMADLARMLGVPSSSIVEEIQSRNTWENAQLTRQVLRPRGVRRVLIVTDSIHMRRAEACFLRAGFEVERASVPQVCVSSSNLAMLRAALHEFGGWLVYRRRGWLGGPHLN
jgi:uncharacterized SAM-binding protein YcdF (DUF218 family)